MSAGARHYLELKFAGHTFLVPNTPDVSIEPRENMQSERKGRAAASRSLQGVLWLGYLLDADLRPTADGAWTRAVFLNARGTRPVGLLVNDLRVLPADALRIEPFTPLGPAPVQGQHLFHAAAMQASTLTLVFSPTALAAYLQAQEGGDGFGE